MTVQRFLSAARYILPAMVVMTGCAGASPEAPQGAENPPELNPRDQETRNHETSLRSKCGTEVEIGPAEMTALDAEDPSRAHRLCMNALDSVEEFCEKEGFRSWLATHVQRAQCQADGSHRAISMEVTDGTLAIRYPPEQSNIYRVFEPALRAIHDADFGTLGDYLTFWDAYVCSDDTTQRHLVVERDERGAMRCNLPTGSPASFARYARKVSMATSSRRGSSTPRSLQRLRVT